MTSSCTPNVPHSSNRSWRVGVCDFSPWVDTRLLSPYSHKVFSRLLCSHSPRVFTCPLPRYNPQVFTRPLHSRSTWVFTCSLWRRSTLPTRHLVTLCTNRWWALWGMLRHLVSFSIRMWRSLLLMPLSVWWFVVLAVAGLESTNSEPYASE